LGGGLVLLAAPAFANGYGTDTPWAFETSADQANMAAVQVLIQQKQHGMFNSPVYNTYNNTTIQQQTNCSVSATTYGSYALNGATANSPTTTGASASAQGNSGASTVSSTGVSPIPINLTDSQSNTGAVGSYVQGNTSVSNGGPVSQALNSTQTNGGSQTAGVSNSVACSGVK
jgi:hypothetical protein